MAATFFYLCASALLAQVAYGEFLPFPSSVSGNSILTNQFNLGSSGNNVANSGIAVANGGLSTVGVAKTGLSGIGLANSGLIGGGVGLVGAGLNGGLSTVGVANTGLSGIGLANSGLIGGGVGLVGAGLNGGLSTVGVANTGLSGIGLANTGLIGGGVGLVGAGLKTGVGANLVGYPNLLNIVPSGPLTVTTISPIGPSGLSVASENEIVGTLTVTGALPFLSAVAFEGAFPTAGSGVATCGCGNGAVGILNEGFPAITPGPVIGIGSGIGGRLY